MRCRALIAVVALGLPMAPALAADTSPSMQTFGQFVELCSQSGDTVTVAFCNGYVLGNGQLYLALRNAGAVKSWACADPVPTLDEIRAKLVEWGKAHPEQAGIGTVDGVWQAAAEIWPCS